MATTPPDGSVVNGDPTSPAVNNDVSKEPQAAAPLSASAMTFNPGETNGSANPTTTNATDGSSSTELLSPSAVLWGIGSQSYSGVGTNSPNVQQGSSQSSGGQPPSTPGSTAPGSNVGTPAKEMNASSQSLQNTTATTANNTTGATQGEDSLGGLWNFGGFDVDALTNENNNKSQQSNNRHQKQQQNQHPRAGFTNNNNNATDQGNISGLSSAFGNFGLQQGPPPSHAQQNNHYGGGNKYDGGAPQAGKFAVFLN